MNVNKKLLYFISAAAMLLTASCSKPPPVTPYSLSQIAGAVISSQENINLLNPLAPDDGYYTDYLSSIYHIDASTVTDGMICYPIGMTADEISILIIAVNEDVKSIKESLLEYKDSRAAAFTGYAPTQAAVAQNGVVVVHGNYIALLICEDTKSAEAAFLACFSGEPPELPVGDIFIRQTESTRASVVGEGTDAEPEKAPEQEATTSYNDTAAGRDWTDETDSSPDPVAATISGSGTQTGLETDSAAGLDIVKNPGAVVNPGAALNPDTAADPDATTKQEITTNPDTTSNSGAKDPAYPDITPGTAPYDAANDAYDHTAILAAWRGELYSDLSIKNKGIYDACARVISELITGGMTDYEKELAIHDWMIGWASYDMEVYNNAPNAAPDPDNDNPYGLLINAKAICRGFSVTFQLFMDMAGIECITVDGTSYPGNEEHAWNMVRIGGDWYCVDVTWNNPIDSNRSARSDAVTHKYFNVTSDFMWDTGHRWDTNATPEATAPNN